MTVSRCQEKQHFAKIDWRLINVAQKIKNTGIKNGGELSSGPTPILMSKFDSPSKTSDIFSIKDPKVLCCFLNPTDSLLNFHIYYIINICANVKDLVYRIELFIYGAHLSGQAIISCWYNLGSQKSFITDILGIIIKIGDISRCGYYR